jgi:predicted acylesterase/phospholipase RssA
MARDVALTLAGGGNRALVQTGMLRRWWPLLEPRIAVLSACSAGASMAVSLLTGRELEARRTGSARAG